MFLGGFAVEFDAEAGAGGGEEVAVLPFGLYGHHVGEDSAGGAWLFLYADERGGQAHLQARCAGDRTERVVHGELDVVGLTPAGNLARFGEAADDAEVNAGVVDPLFFDQLAEFPFGRELLACGQRHTGTRAQRFERVGVLAAQRIFDEEGIELFHLLAEPDGFGQVEAGVDVEADLDLLAQSFAHRLELLDRLAHGLPRLEDLAVVG